VFCTGTSVRGATRSEPGWTGVPVCIGGVTVHPDDVLVADDDGVVVVPRASAQEVLLAAQEKARKQAAREQRLRAGEPYDI
jgi:4-hydroxy-4-methyl-2-oxoglutarate aldolase